MPAMCDERERLLSYLYDECDADERRKVEQHLETCATCRDEIGGLRGVRQDLLAWEVPDHGSVWRPFVPARVTPWWRGVPAWAMAAAASLVFLVGAAGGLATHALLAPALLAQAAPPPAVARSSVTRTDLAALEQRLLTTMQAQMDERVALVSSHASPASQSSLTPDEVLRQLRLYMRESDRQQQQVVSVLRELNNGMATMSKNYNSRFDSLDSRVTRVSDLVAGQNR